MQFNIFNSNRNARQIITLASNPSLHLLSLQLSFGLLTFTCADVSGTTGQRAKELRSKKKKSEHEVDTERGLQKKLMILYRYKKRITNRGKRMR